MEVKTKTSTIAATYLNGQRIDSQINDLTELVATVLEGGAVTVSVDGQLYKLLLKKVERS